MEMVQLIPTSVHERYIARAWLKHAHSFDRRGPIFDTATQTGPAYNENLNGHKRIEVCAKSIKNSVISDPISSALEEK